MNKTDTLIHREDDRGALAETESQIVSTSGAWVKFMFTTPPVLTEGSTYHLAVRAEDPAEIGQITSSD